MESPGADRSQIRLRDHVDAVVAAIDALDPIEGWVALVGHSAGAAIAHAAVDARPDRVARAVYVGGFPTGDGDSIVDGVTAVNGEIPLPEWSSFEDEELADLDAKTRADFRQRGIPSPELVTRDPQRLVDERRYDVPVTVVCTEFTSQMLQGWMADGEGPVRELAKMREVEFVDLPTGHWPQFTRPADLGGLIADRLLRATIDGSTGDERGVGQRSPR